MEFDAAPLLDEPEAIFLRVIAQAIDAVAGARARPVRLERFERHILGELRPALGAGAPLRFTLAGCLIEARENRRLVLTPEPPRRSRGA